MASFSAGDTYVDGRPLDDRPNDGASESRGLGEVRRKRLSDWPAVIANLLADSKDTK